MPETNAGAKGAAEKLSLENDQATLLENLQSSQKQVLQALQNYKAAKYENGIRDKQYSAQDIQLLQKYTEQLQKYINQIFAVDHTIYIMIKMIKVSSVIIQHCQKPMIERQFKEIQSAYEGQKLYLISAIAYLKCLFGDALQ